MSLPSEVDVAIIGAGAAGLGAAHALQDIPASPSSCWKRATGSADAATPSWPRPTVTFDLGCGWLHSADSNSFVKIAEELNFEIDRTLPPWRERAYGKAFPQRSAPNSSARWTPSTTAPSRPPNAAAEVAATAAVSSPAIAGIR